MYCRHGVHSSPAMVHVQIGLTGFKCRCGYVFCGSHRLAEAHECDFDYKTAGRDNLAKANPLIQVRKQRAHATITTVSAETPCFPA